MVKHLRSKRGETLVRAVGAVTRPKVHHVTEEHPDLIKAKALVQEAKGRQKKSQIHIVGTLPSKLLVLRDIFMALQAVYKMMKHRNKLTTFDGVKAGVEETSRRRFEEKHVFQLKTLVPELVDVEMVYSSNGKTRASSKITYLLIKLPMDGKISPADAQHILEVAMYDYLCRSYEEYLEQQPDKKRTFDKKVGNFESPYPEAVPDVPECKSNLHVTSPEPNIAEQRPVPSSPGSSQTSTVEKPAIVNASQEHQTKQKQSPSEEIGLQSPRKKRKVRARTPRRLSFTATSDFARDMANTDLTGAPMTLPSAQEGFQDSSILESMPNELRRRSLDGVISLSSLQKLSHNETEQRRLSGAEAVALRTERATLKALPRTLQSIRTIIGRKGPKAIRLDELVDTLKDGGAKLTTKTDVKLRIHSLAEHAPEFIEIKPWSSDDPTPTVWVNRNCDYTDVLTKLKLIVDRRA